MDTATPPAAGARFLWEADRYEKAVACGIFRRADPIELVDGELITHAGPQHSPHATAIQLCAAVLDEVFGDGFLVRQQMPLRLGGASVPEPDLAVVRGAIRDFSRAHPRTADLIVEVADSSVGFDRGRKLRLYAREGIVEYWIVNLAEENVEIFRRPAGEAYAEARVYRRGETILAGPRAQPVAVGDLLP